MQHAIRASGVACQPAHTARLPAHNARAATTAAIRREMVTVHLACETERVVSNHTATDDLSRLPTLHDVATRLPVENAGKNTVISIFASDLPRNRQPRRWTSADSVEDDERTIRTRDRRCKAPDRNPGV